MARPIQHEELAADRDMADEWVKLATAAASVVQADDRFGGGAGVDRRAESLPYDRRAIYQAKSFGRGNPENATQPLSPLECRELGVISRGHGSFDNASSGSPSSILKTRQWTESNCF